MPSKIILLYALLVTATVNCLAQDTTKSKAKIPAAIWGEFGAGTSSVGGFSAILYDNAQITQRLVITGGIQGESNQGASVINFSARHEVDLTSGSLLLGNIYKQEYSMFVVSVGLSYVQYQDKMLNGLFSSTPDVIQTKNTVGVPVLLRGYWVLGQCVGLGAGIYGNLNTKQSSIGVTLLLAGGTIQTHHLRHIKKNRDPLHIFGK